MLLAGVLSGGLYAQMGGMEGEDEAEDNSAEIDIEFKEYDADGDGKITKEEMKKSLGEEADDFDTWMDTYMQFLMLDANDDGVVTKDEYAKLYDEDFEEKLSSKDVDSLTAEIYTKADTDKDGNLTKAEIKAIDGEDMEDEEFKEFDSDSDGKISKGEFKSAMKKMLEIEDDEKKTSSGNGGDDKTGDTDAYALYKKEGRTWMIKSTSKFNGTELVSYMKYEVKSVADDHAIVVFTMLDKDKKPNEYIKPTEQKIEFVKATEGNGNSDAPEVKTVEETIKVDAGEFECTKTETEVGGNKTTVWMSKKLPGLMVKSTTKSEKMDFVSELVEFKDDGATKKEDSTEKPKEEKKD